MRAEFRPTSPETTELTMSLTMTLAEWRAIHADLDDDRSQEATACLARIVASLILQFNDRTAVRFLHTGFGFPQQTPEEPS